MLQNLKLEFSLFTEIYFRDPQSKHFIFFVTYKWAKKARVFVADRLFHPSLMFVVKATGAYPSVEHRKGYTNGPY